MRKILSAIFALCAAAILAAVPVSAQQNVLILATTTSTQDSGLLDVLVPLFEKESGYRGQDHLRRLRPGHEDGGKGGSRRAAGALP